MELPHRKNLKVKQFLGFVCILFLLVVAVQFLSAKSISGASTVANGYPSSVESFTSPTEVSYPAPRHEVSANQLYLSPVQQKYRLQITPTEPPIADDGWFVFSDEETGYSFHYPLDSHLSVGKGPRVPYPSVVLEYRVPGEVHYHGMTVMVYSNSDGLIPEEYLKSFCDELGTSAGVSQILFSDVNSISVGEVTALKAVIPVTQTDFTIFLPYKDRMLVISPTGDPAFMDDPVKTQAMEIFYRILATFQLNS